MGISSKAKIAYVPAKPFLFADTIKSNIVFGLKYQTDRFNIACEATGLD